MDVRRPDEPQGQARLVRHRAPRRLPVGLVAPDDHSIAYIGVVPEHRGRGLVNDLLARGTRTLAEAGLERIVAATDITNVPTAEAFLRAGYSEVGRLFRYYWRA
ncbi:GNAT family N-acetyltransferase [Nonomuraea antimicrobica]